LERIRAVRQRRSIEGFAPYVTTRSYGGRELRISIEDPLAQGWYDRDWPRLAEIDLLASRGRLGEGARVFDLGAHQCVVALMLAAEVGGSGTVVAVEATPHNAEVGRRNVALNAALDAGAVLVCHAVASSEEGTVAFTPSLNGHVGRTSYAFPTIELPAVTVDSLARTYGTPDVVFVDVEGFEQHVLGGAGRTFGARPDWFVEVHAGVGLEEQEGSVAGVLAQLEDRGYRLFVGNSEEGGPYQPLEGPPPPGRFHVVALG
jgi:FkbM family methyltransferase